MTEKKLKKKRLTCKGENNIDAQESFPVFKRLTQSKKAGKGWLV